MSDDSPAPAAPSSPPPDDYVALRALVEGTAHATGSAFFSTLVMHLARAVGTDYAFVAEFSGPMRARTLAYWKVDRIGDNIEWNLVGTPCEEVVRGALCHHPSEVFRKFPGDKALATLGIESYLGVPLLDASGGHLGHLAVFGRRPMPNEPTRLMTFRIFAARAAAELERLRAERMLRESEQRYRALFDEAPLAYVVEDLESRFVSANRAALDMIGVRPDQVPGFVGQTLVVQTPDVQQRFRAAFERLREGKEQSWVELELRRADTGDPLWIQWWSKPEPDGKHTRTMMIDITQRVLMEREKARLEQQNLYLQEEIKQVHNFEEIVGRSHKLVRVLADVERVAPTDATVLVLGETGTGKELIARAIHNASARRDKPLIKVNCAALPTGLVESELFGHERGAFSGAIARRIGRFELASGGTIFLDEVGEIPFEVQAKLLRVLQEREIERVGGGTPIKVDVRVIAATNRDLKVAVREGTFREDLFYRLNVFPVSLPPLRERQQDIPLLVMFMLGRCRARLGKQIDRIGLETMDRLIQYPWPGNVRELENVIERAAILTRGNVLELDPAALPTVAASAPFAANSGSEPAGVATLEQLERDHVLSVLSKTNWVIEGETGAAKQLGLHPNTLRSRLKRMKISRPDSAATSFQS